MDTTALFPPEFCTSLIIRAILPRRNKWIQQISPLEKPFVSLLSDENQPINLPIQQMLAGTRVRTHITRSCSQAYPCTCPQAHPCTCTPLSSRAHSLLLLSPIIPTYICYFVTFIYYISDNQRIAS